MKLSVCMIVKDEEANLEKALIDAWLIADEIIVVDTGSTDNTREIAEQFDCNVFYHEWKNDFAAARNESIKHATGDWILWMDADDRLPLESANAILLLKRSPLDCFYGFRLKNIDPVNVEFVGETCMQARMYPRIPELKFVNRLHESAVHSAFKAGLKLVERPDICFEHVGYQNAEKVHEKLIRNVKYCLMDLGFPYDTDFKTFKALGYNCFYAPEILTVWDNMKWVGCCDSFDSGKPETEQEQNEKILRRAMDIAEGYNKKKTEVVIPDYPQIALDEIARMDENTQRMEQVFI